jgi:two-component system sensor histidine kinase MprB
MTLRTRLTLAVAAIVAAAVVVGALASDLSTRRGLRSETDKFLLARAERFTGGQDGGGPDLGRPERPGPGGQGGRDGGRPPLVEFDAVSQIIDRQGTITSALADQPALPVDAKDIALASSRGEPRLRDVRVGGIDYRMVSASLPGGGAVQIARSVEESEDILAVLRSRLVGIVLFGTALAALLGWALARRTTAPIERLTGAAEHIATTQDLTTPIPVRGSDEVGRLAASFNSMLGALATSRHQQQRLVADASHELRTPLTAIRTNIEFLERAGTLSEGERQALLHETTLELTELTDLVVELVELATDARNDEHVTEVDLAGVAEDVAARFRRRTGRHIEVLDAGAAVIQARRAMVDRALSNLVDNALKFSDGPEPVQVSVTGGRIEVADRGPGVSEEDRGRVFDRFYRADAARTRPGSGLGLSIVAQIAAAHGGTVALHPREGGGTVARLELPLS